MPELRDGPRSSGTSARRTEATRETHMFRKRLVAGCILAASTFAASTVITTVASAQEVIDLDEEPTPKPKKGGGRKAKPKKAEEAADEGGGEEKPAGKKGVDIDLDEDDGGESEPVSAGQMTEQAASAKKLFDKERWSEAALAL